MTQEEYNDIVISLATKGVDYAETTCNFRRQSDPDSLRRETEYIMFRNIISALQNYDITSGVLEDEEVSYLIELAEQILTVCPDQGVLANEWLSEPVVAERMILASFGGGISPYAGFFRSYDDGLTWALSKSFGETWEAGAWFAYAALTTQGGANYFVGQPYEGGCILYDVDNDVFWLKDDNNDAGTSVIEDFTAGRLLISTAKGIQYGKGFRFNIVTEQWDNIANINQDIYQVIAIDPDIIVYATYGGIYCFNYTPSLRQVGQFTAMIKTADGNLYAGDENGNVWKSEDNASTWSDMGNKAPGSAILVMCSIGAGRILFYDYQDLWITDDQFVNVTKVKDGGSYGALLKVTEDICLAFNANGGTYSGVYRSEDNGSTWELLPLDPAFEGFVFGAIKYDL